MKIEQLKDLEMKIEAIRYDYSEVGYEREDIVVDCWDIGQALECIDLENVISISFINWNARKYHFAGGKKVFDEYIKYIDYALAEVDGYNNKGIQLRFEFDFEVKYFEGGETQTNEITIEKDTHFTY